MSLAAQRFLRPSRLPFRHFGLRTLNGQRTHCLRTAHLPSLRRVWGRVAIGLLRRIRLPYNPPDAMRRCALAPRKQESMTSTPAAAMSAAAAASPAESAR
jgi:hypothetical protein